MRYDFSPISVQSCPKAANLVEDPHAAEKHSSISNFGCQLHQMLRFNGQKGVIMMLVCHDYKKAPHVFFKMRLKVKTKCSSAQSSRFSFDGMQLQSFRLLNLQSFRLITPARALDF